MIFTSHNTLTDFKSDLVQLLDLKPFTHNEFTKKNMIPYTYTTQQLIFI